MMMSAGHTLFASLTPIHSVTLKNHHRWSSNMFFTRARKLVAYNQMCQLHRKPLMVAARYLPPWFSVAPMMEWTDNHYRTLARLISKHAWLYTEMHAAETIIHQKENLLWMSQPKGSWTWVFWCSPYAGSKGKFVAEAMSVIAANSDAPVSVKCRIGVDDYDSYDELCDFIDKVSSQSPTRHFIIHSRKALLNGISPADNRRIPPLKYEYYYALLRDFPGLRFTINGGINGVDEVNAARREGAHGVMVGRAAYNNPWNILGHVDSAVYGAPCTNLTRRQVLEKYQVYGDSVLRKYGHRPTVREVVKPLLGLFHSEPGNGLWKRKADSALRYCTTIKSFLEETLVAIPDSVLDSTVGEAPSGCVDTFAKLNGLLPPPYAAKEYQALCA